jgi:hypothetical protein
MSPSPDLLLLFGGLFLRGLFRLLRFLGHVTLSKCKVGSMDLCRRESACTTSTLHHNHKIDTVLLKPVPMRDPRSLVDRPRIRAGRVSIHLIASLIPTACRAAKKDRLPSCDHSCNGCIRCSDDGVCSRWKSASCTLSKQAAHILSSTPYSTGVLATVRHRILPKETP